MRYEEPKIEIMALKVVDVITTSGSDVDPDTSKDWGKEDWD